MPKKERYLKYWVNLVIVWYLADNNLAYIGHAFSRDNNRDDFKIYI